jgi:transposase
VGAGHRCSTGDHHAVGRDPTGKRLHDGPLPNNEAKLRALFDKLAAHGPLPVVVDQPATIGALPVAVARAAGHQVAYLPGLAMRRIADLYPGTAKTDARDAFIIADAALICLARRRCDVLYAMLRNHTHYRHRQTNSAPAAA